MALKGSNRNGGCSRDSTGIIIMWKMKKANDIGCFVQVIMMRQKSYQWFIHGFFA